MAKCNPNSVLQIAMNEVGYLEKKSNSQLDSKTANAGKNNYTKYNRDYNAWGGGGAQPMEWCASFVSWCFVTAFGLAAACTTIPPPAQAGLRSRAAISSAARANLRWAT